VDNQPRFTDRQRSWLGPLWLVYLLCRWRNQYGGMKADDVKRLKALEAENARLRRIVADKELEIDAWKEIGRAKW